MKKFINNPAEFVNDSLAGILSAYPGYLQSIHDTFLNARRIFMFESSCPRQKRALGVLSYMNLLLPGGHTGGTRPRP